MQKIKSQIQKNMANLWHSAGSVNGPWGNSGYYKNTNENTENIEYKIPSMKILNTKIQK